MDMTREVWVRVMGTDIKGTGAMLLINHSSILSLMALNSLYCADVPLSNYSLIHSLTGAVG